MSKRPNQYPGDHEVKVFKGFESIRCRPAMYIGDIGQLGLHSLVMHLLLQGAEEYSLGQASRIDLRIHSEGTIQFGIDGPGIALGPIHEYSQHDLFLEDNRTLFEIQFSELCISKNLWFNRLGHLHGVNTLPICNALSEYLSATNYRDGYVWELGFQKGQLKSHLKRLHPTDRTGLEIAFKPDVEIFKDVTFDYERIRKRMQELSFLVPGVKLSLRDDRSGREDRFYHPDGLAGFVRHLNRNADVLFAEPFTHQKEFEGARIGVAFQPRNGFETRVSSFVNSHTCTEGTHILGFRAGLKQALAAYGKSHGLFLDRFPTIEHYYEGMTAVISVWLEDPMYEGPTRFKLGNVEMASTVAGVVREGIESWAKQRPEAIHQMVDKAIAAAERYVS